MKAEDVQLVNLLEGAKQFIVPVFQRDYSWETKHCLQLWEDIVQAGETPHVKAHFVGSIVYIAAEENSAKINRWLLIDGQQRLTTVLLLLTAFRNHLQEQGENIGPSSLPTADEVSDYYLINRHAKGEERHKLQLRRTDHDSMVALLDKTELPATHAERILENFTFFAEKVRECDLDILVSGIRKLIAVQVVLLRGQDDPQLIFESLNSTGLELAQADLIRNFVLMRQEEQVQSGLYNNFWRPMELEFDSRYRSDFDRFVRDYLTLRQKLSKPVRTEEIYRNFRQYFYDQGGEPVAAKILADLRQFSRYYVAYTMASHSSPGVNRAFRRLKTLVEIAGPLMMRLLHCHETLGTLELNGLIEATESLESYVFRRSVCGLETRSLGRIFSALAFDIDDSDPLQSLKVSIALQGPNRRFPDDLEFKEALETRNIYAMRHCHYLLDRIENNSKERIDTLEFTIEHILPQNPRLSKEWRAMLGDSWKEIQGEWVDRLGNITLTGYNAEYSDRPFEHKKSVDGGFSDSPLRLNKFVKAQEKWGQKEIEVRGRQLASAAIKVWTPMQIDQAVVRQARLKKMQEEASEYSEKSLAIESDVQALFDNVRQQVLAVGADVTEIFHPKSVTYRVFDYFVELLPRKQHVTLLFNMDFEDCDDPSQLARDASNKAFITNASVQGGVIMQVWAEEDIPAAMHLVRQAYEQMAE